VSSRFRLAALLALVVTSSAGAHPLAPALLELEERPDGVTAVLWRTPLLKPTGGAIVPELPAGCENVTAPSAEEEVSSVAVRWSVRCEGGWVGSTVSVRGLDETRTTAVLRVTLADGRELEALLSGGEESYVIPARRSRSAVLRAYVGLGVRHLSTGPDHLLFVLGLLLLVPLGRQLLLTITAFTFGHSLTLSAAILGWVAVPQQPIEIGIAASIVFVAAEVAARESSAKRAPKPWILALVFGLLHGLGFAGALSAIGLPAGGIPLALFGFNVGVEIGQLAWVAAFAAASALVLATGRATPPWLGRAVAYGIGSLGALWCLERIVALA